MILGLATDFEMIFTVNFFKITLQNIYFVSKVLLLQKKEKKKKNRNYPQKFCFLLSDGTSHGDSVDKPQCSNGCVVVGW